MAAAGVMLECDFQPRRRHKRTENGLSERRFESKSFTIIVARTEPISPKNSGPRADWEGNTRFR